MSQVLTVTEAAEARKSIRKYTGADISDYEIREILRVAGLAPSPWNVQPWRVVVVQGQENKDKLMAAAYNQPQVGAAAAVLVVYNDMKDAVDNALEYVHPGFGEGRQAEAEKEQAMFRSWPDEKVNQWGHGISYIFVGFLLLALKSHGWDSSPMLGFDPDQVKALYDLPPHATVPTIIAIGKGAEEGFTHHRHDVDRIATFVG